MRRIVAWVSLLSSLTTTVARADGESARLVELRFTPTARAQIAVWIENPEAGIFQTLRLTEAVSRRGIGNRPGALQMNSGFRWPYGRREGALPVWAHRRVEAGGLPFRRVIFRDRVAEGLASQAPGGMFTDYADNPDDYFCLSFNRGNSAREALDAVTCASVFNSDKGRYITDADVRGGYHEPVQLPNGSASNYALGMESLYPPRRDVECVAACRNHPDVGQYNADALAVMPELDAVSTATLPEEPYTVLFSVPADWPDGSYTAYVEVNVEGDYNGSFDPAAYPTPSDPTPEVYGDNWDSWAMSFGYPYRGQPSVVFTVPFTFGAGGTISQTASTPTGFGDVEGRGDQVMHEMSSAITDEPVAAPGSGADRLRKTADGWRVKLFVRSPEFCDGNAPPSAVGSLTATPYREESHSHQWAHLSFLASSDDRAIHHYEARVSTTPITDEQSFERGVPANAASLDTVALNLPSEVAAGQPIDVDFGGLAPQTIYYIGVRAVDECNVASPIATAQVETTAINFTTVSPCVVTTAAYGSPLASDVGALRRFRDRHLMTNSIGRALVDAYYAHGPILADFVRTHEGARSLTREILRPIVAVARLIDGE